MLTRPYAAAEMVTYLPIASPFIRLGGFWVDDAWGFALGWNYFFLMGMSYSILFNTPVIGCICLTAVFIIFTAAFAIPYEITAINVLLTFWTDKIPIAAVVVICLVIYACAPSTAQPNLG